MLKWAKREAGILRQAVKQRRSVGQVRRWRDETDTMLAKDAAALEAKLGDLRQATHRGPGVMSMATKFGVLHLRPRDTDMLVIRQVFVDREYDIDRFAQMDRIKASYDAMLQRGETPVVVDAGANIGAASLWFATHFPKAAFIAVEPDPGNAAVARLNLANISDAQVVEAAIGARSGMVKLQTFEDQGWGARTERCDEGIPIVTVNDLLAGVPNGRLLIAKIDIEGFEGDLFSDNIEWVDQAVAVIIEPHDWMLPEAGTSQSFQAALLHKGREILIAGENLIFV